MVVNTFDLYDILTDIIPGIIGTLLLIVLFAPATTINRGSGLVVGTGGALLIIAIAYVVGRIIRNIRLWKYIMYRKEASGPFERTLQSIILGQSDLDDDLVQQFKEVINDKYEFSRPDVSDEEVDSNVEFDMIQLFNTVVPVGYSELYNRQTLYRRYTIISSFYESLSTLFLLAAIGFWISGTGTEFPLIDYWPTLWTQLWNTSITISMLVISSLIIISFIGFGQYRVFDRRRAVAFVVDIIKTSYDAPQD